PQGGRANFWLPPRREGSILSPSPLVGEGRGGGWARPNRSTSQLGQGHLQVVIEEELVRDGPEVDRGELALALVGDPGLDHVGGEDISLEEPGVVVLEGSKHLTQRPRRAL